MRDPFARKRDDFVLVRLPIGAQHHAGLDRLAPALIRYTDDRTIGNRRMLHQHVLNLSRIDVLAARNDHILNSIVDEQIAITQIAGIAGAKPAALIIVSLPALRERLHGSGRVTPIAQHILRGPDPNFADVAIGTGIAGFGIDNTQIDASTGAAGGAQQRFLWAFRVMVLRRQIRDRAGRLGQTIDLQKAALKGMQGVDQHLVGDRRGAVGDDFQRAVVGTIDTVSI